MYQTIFHCDDEKKVKKCFNNVENLLRDIEEADEEIRIEILANGSAVSSFKKESNRYEERISLLSKKNVQLALCQNSLNGHNLTAKEMVDKAKIVVSGVGELTRKQNQGWAYIKV